MHQMKTASNDRWYPNIKSRKLYKGKIHRKSHRKSWMWLCSVQFFFVNFTTMNTITVVCIIWKSFEMRKGIQKTFFYTPEKIKIIRWINVYRLFWNIQFIARPFFGAYSKVREKFQIVLNASVSTLYHIPNWQPPE